MEDAHAFVYDFGDVPGQGFFGIFDGHAGKDSAEWCGRNFHQVSPWMRHRLAPTAQPKTLLTLSTFVCHSNFWQTSAAARKSPCLICSIPHSIRSTRSSRTLLRKRAPRAAALLPWRFCGSKTTLARKVTRHLQKTLLPLPKVRPSEPSPALVCGARSRSASNPVTTPNRPSRDKRPRGCCTPPTSVILGPCSGKCKGIVHSLYTLTLLTLF